MCELAPQSVVLEVTESVLADPAGPAAGSLEVLRQVGARVAIDDFGTGYSSMAYLHQLPVDVLKIDRAFVSAEPQAQRGHAILEAIAGLAHHLELDLVAEGVEGPAQVSRLLALGCPVGQGFLFSPPVSGRALEAFCECPGDLGDDATTGAGRTSVVAPAR